MRKNITAIVAGGAVAAAATIGAVTAPYVLAQNEDTQTTQQPTNSVPAPAQTATVEDFALLLDTQQKVLDDITAALKNAPEGSAAQAILERQQAMAERHIDALTQVQEALANGEDPTGIGPMGGGFGPGSGRGPGMMSQGFGTADGRGLGMMRGLGAGGGQGCQV